MPEYTYGGIRGPHEEWRVITTHTHTDTHTHTYVIQQCLLVAMILRNDIMPQSIKVGQGMLKNTNTLVIMCNKA